MGKYMIEIEDVPFSRVRIDADNGAQNINLYRAKGFNALVFDEHGLDKLTPLDKALSSELGEAYHKGLEEGKMQAKAQAHLDVCHDIERVARANYQKGLDDAWNTITKIVKMPDGERGKVFGETWISNILNKFSVSEIINILDGYESEQDKIKVGDEVKNTLDFMDKAAGYFFGDSSDGCYKVLRYVDGKFKTGIWNKENCKRTGKHSDAVVQLLEAMKEVTE